MTANNDIKTPCSLSLYIHIPFCVKKCLYCDFLSFSVSGSKKEKYVKALLNELSAWEEIFKSSTKSVDNNTHELYFDTVFIGGGTPTYLEPSHLLKIGQAIKRYTDENTEFTIEANPGTISDDHIEVFKKIGINRISLGLQSAQDNELEKLGRIHTYEEFYKNYQKLKKAGFDNINIDIMSKIPAQTLKSYKDTLYKVATLLPQHISAYSLIVEPDTEFYKMQELGKLDTADEDTDRKMYYMTKEVLRNYGYTRYEISNYSKQGKECRHNIAYWTGKDYLGIGLGASSYINGARFTGTKDFEKYIKIFEKRFLNGNALPQVHENIGEDYIKLSNTDKMEEFMFLGLRMCKGVLKSEFAKKFGVEIDAIYGDVIKHYLQNNLLAEDTNSGRIYFTDRGLDISNYVLSDFIL